MEIILATTSVYKKQLFGRLGLPFNQIDSQLDESLYSPGKEESLDQYAIKLALLKAKNRQSEFPKAHIIGADQVLELEGQVFGKPGSKEKNIEQLKLFAGKTHFLHTAVAILSPNKEEKTFCVSTKMKMKNLSNFEIEEYVSKEMAIDCAGGYKIESFGISLFESIEAEDFTAIEGLPLLRLNQLLRG